MEQHTFHNLGEIGQLSTRVNTLILILLQEFGECSFELFVFGFFRNFPGKLQGRVVRKPVSPNPGLEVNRSFNFSSIKNFYSLRFAWFELNQSQS